jgi:hypothetical protein
MQKRPRALSTNNQEAQMGVEIKHRAKPRRNAAAKRKAKLTLMSLFDGWQDLEPKLLEQRVDEIRWLAAGQRRLNDAEWRALDRMRDKMRANQKFTKAVREARHVAVS